MKKIILLMIIASFCICDTCPIKATETGKPIVIVLDPGHDDTHSGAGGSGLREEQLNLKIAQYCYEELSTYHNVKVYMTRDSMDCPYAGTSVKDDNQKRVEFAKSVVADAYVSLHLNSATAAAKGVEIFYPNANFRPAVSTTGKNLAQAILEELVGLGLYERGVFIRNGETSRYEDGSVGDYYQVIREAKKHNIPGVIVEHAFLSNSSDVTNFLSTEAQLQALGVADATGIAKCFGLRKGGYEKIFDADFYANKYEDVKELYGNDGEKLLDHFIKSGMKEGRQGVESFEPYAYRGRYADLLELYGDQLEQYYYHYMDHGHAEGRDGTPMNSQYTVTFISEGKTVSTQMIAFGHGAIAPEVSKEGMNTIFDRPLHCITTDTMIQITYEAISVPKPAPAPEPDTNTETERASETETATETELTEEETVTEGTENITPPATAETEQKDTDTQVGMHSHRDNGIGRILLLILGTLFVLAGVAKKIIF